jgi:hypothetical protein
MQAMMDEKFAGYLSGSSWKAIDTDKLITDIYASRKRSSRPQVQL